MVLGERLEALTLSWNCLSDVRLVETLLRARARLCYEGRVAALQLLDLSGNVGLQSSGEGAWRVWIGLSWPSHALLGQARLSLARPGMYVRL